MPNASRETAAGRFLLFTAVSAALSTGPANKPASVTLNNYGTMTSLNASKGGAQAVDFTGITSGTNIINNFATGVMRARDADAVRPGTNGVVNNYGTIISTVTTDTGSDGVDVQNGTGVTINNFSGGSITGSSAQSEGVTVGGGTIINSGTIEGDVAAGNTNAVGRGGTNAMTITPGAGNHFGYAGSISNFNTVEVQSGTTTLSGASTFTGNTVVTGGRLVLDGANRLSSDSGLQLNGRTLEIANAGGANGQTFASLSLTDHSTLDLDQSSVTFNTVSDIAAGKSLSVLDWSSETSPTYAFRLLGDDTTNAAFLALIDGTTINGLEAIFHFDGTCTDVSAVGLSFDNLSTAFQRLYICLREQCA
jgi:autotransporter-associated beta strand protein